MAPIMNYAQNISKILCISTNTMRSADKLGRPICHHQDKQKIAGLDKAPPGVYPNSLKENTKKEKNAL